MIAARAEVNGRQKAAEAVGLVAGLSQGTVDEARIVDEGADGGRPDDFTDQASPQRKNCAVGVAARLSQRYPRFRRGLCATFASTLNSPREGLPARMLFEAANSSAEFAALDQIYRKLKAMPDGSSAIMVFRWTDSAPGEPGHAVLVEKDGDEIYVYDPHAERRSGWPPAWHNKVALTAVGYLDHTGEAVKPLHDPSVDAAGHIRDLDLAAQAAYRRQDPTLPVDTRRVDTRYADPLGDVVDGLNQQQIDDWARDLSGEYGPYRVVFKGTTPYPDRVQLRGEIFDGTRRIGRIERVFLRDKDGNLVARDEWVEVGHGFRNEGFYKALSSELDSYYARCGVHRTEVLTEEKGAYTAARRGFTWHPDTAQRRMSLISIKASASRLSRRVSEEGQTVLANYMGRLDLDPEDPRFPEPIELAGLHTDAEPDLGRQLLEGTEVAYVKYHRSVAAADKIGLAAGHRDESGGPDEEGGDALSQERQAYRALGPAEREANPDHADRLGGAVDSGNPELVDQLGKDLSGIYGPYRVEMTGTIHVGTAGIRLRNEVVLSGKIFKGGIEIGSLTRVFYRDARKCLVARHEELSFFDEQNWNEEFHHELTSKFDGLLYRRDNVDRIEFDAVRSEARHLEVLEDCTWERATHKRSLASVKRTAARLRRDDNRSAEAKAQIDQLVPRLKRGHPNPPRPAEVLALRTDSEPDLGRQLLRDSTVSIAKYLFPEMAHLPIWDEVRGIVSVSERLIDQWRACKADMWKFEFDSDEGTYTDAIRRVIKFGKIAPKHDASRMVESIAHELGHAAKRPRRAFIWNDLTRKGYIRAGLNDEGEAVWNEIEVAREILARGGPDILRSGDREVAEAYQKLERIYDDCLEAGSTRKAYWKAIRAMGDIYGNFPPGGTTFKNYSEYLGWQYDKMRPWRNPPRAGRSDDPDHPARLDALTRRVDVDGVAADSNSTQPDDPRAAAKAVGTVAGGRDRDYVGAPAGERGDGRGAGGHAGTSLAPSPREELVDGDVPRDESVDSGTPTQPQPQVVSPPRSTTEDYELAAAPVPPGGGRTVFHRHPDGGYVDVVLTGPDGRKVELRLTPGQEYVLGRGDRELLQDVVPGTVSRGHATIWVDENGHVFLRDNGSVNGTFVDGKQMVAETEVRIYDGQRVMLGRAFELGVNFQQQMAEVRLFGPDGPVLQVYRGQYVDVGRDMVPRGSADRETVSGRHVRVGMDEDGRVWIQDLGSTNGTWVNGVGLTRDRPIAYLASGESIHLGQYQTEVHFRAPPVAIDTGPVDLRIGSGPGALQVRLEPGQVVPVGIDQRSPFAAQLRGVRRIDPLHATLGLDNDGRLWIRDHPGSHGVWINGDRIMPGQKVTLNEGDRIAIGPEFTGTAHLGGAEHVEAEEQPLLLRLSGLAGDENAPPLVLARGGWVHIGRDPSWSAMADQLAAHTWVSGRHATIYRDLYGDLWLGDEHSTNGTWVNDVQVHPDQPLRLRPGDRIRLGNWEASAEFVDDHVQQRPLSVPVMLNSSHGDVSLELVRGGEPMLLGRNSPQLPTRLPDKAEISN
ncbi:MAG: FHA domain-containing protein [Mycobacterium sp.]|nr:FHA domain-containing protein [Mycobacterium sp.]